MSMFNFVASQHCSASFWRQTNIKISRNLGSLLGEQCSLSQWKFASSHLIAINQQWPDLWGLIFPDHQVIYQWMQEKNQADECDVSEYEDEVSFQFGFYLPTILQTFLVELVFGCLF